MSILVDESTKLLVQGITGREGMARARLMLTRESTYAVGWELLESLAGPGDLNAPRAAAIRSSCAPSSTSNSSSSWT